VVYKEHQYSPKTIIAHCFPSFSLNVDVLFVMFCQSVFFMIVGRAMRVEDSLKSQVKGQPMMIYIFTKFDLKYFPVGWNAQA